MISKQLKKISDIYKEGKNITQYINEMKGAKYNDTESILIAYEFQSGSYSEIARKNSKFRQEYTNKIAEVIDSLEADTICEVGVGEATTLSGVVKQLKRSPAVICGFDLSWSRIKYAQKFCIEEGLSNKSTHLFSADMFAIPLEDKCLDLLYTSHSLEPNRGREEEALRELIRVARKWIVLLEPSYELAGEEQRERMDKLGYVRDLPGTLERLGATVVEHKLFEIHSNPLNKTALTIAKMPIIEEYKMKTQLAYVCPITKMPLKYINNCFFGEECLLTYPIIEGVPCLHPQNAIVTARFPDFL
ncbi:MAG: methyltransferase domain-containing protein [Bdellovibrionaceae bacterium]|nr:methyltransferase domain-containing protein [Pseudobdellovibrionaceae bacterium]